MTLAVACTAAQLAGNFSVVRNSAGAGNIVYALNAKNVSKHMCFVTGMPGVTLVDKNGHALPTHAQPSNPGALTAVMVTLKPGASAKATARFSPDVPGVGEPVSGRQCEPTAYTLRVRPSGGGMFKAPIRPPTPVCEHGGMSWTVFTAR